MRNLMYTVLFLLLISCKDEFPNCKIKRSDNPAFYKFTYDYDSIREKNGFESIKKNLIYESSACWCTTDPYSCCAHFVCKDTSLFPRLEIKKVFWTDSEIILEEDWYISPNKKDLIYKRFDVLLSNNIKYQYGFEENGIFKKITATQFDSIKKSWFLSQQSLSQTKY